MYLHVTASLMKQPGTRNIVTSLSYIIVLVNALSVGSRSRVRECVKINMVLQRSTSAVSRYRVLAKVGKCNLLYFLCTPSLIHSEFLKSSSSWVKMA